MCYIHTVHNALRKKCAYQKRINGKSKVQEEPSDHLKLLLECSEYSFSFSARLLTNRSDEDDDDGVDRGFF